MRQDNFLETIAGVGPLTASALAASIGNPQAFRDGLELAAWLGLVSRQYSRVASRACWASASAAIQH